MSAKRSRRSPGEEFRRQVILEVYLPMGIGLVLVGILVGGIWGSGAGTASVWADAAIVILVIPVLVLMILGLALFIALSIGIGRVLGWIPPQAGRTYKVVVRVQAAVRRLGDGIVAPVLAVRSAAAAAASGVRRLASVVRRT